MKRIVGLSMGLVLMLAAGSVKASGSFEGEVDMKMTHDNADKSTIMQYYVKGHRMRTQVEGKDGYSGGGIYDWQSHEMIVIMDKQKMYMVSQLHPEKFTYGKDHHFKMTKTGNTQEILGYNCREYDYTSDDNNGKIWFASGIGNWWGAEMAAQSDKLPPEQRAIVSMVVAQKLFPMKFETTDKSGKVKGGMEVVKVEKKSVSSNLFEVPAGYKKFDMDKMMGGHGGGSQDHPGNGDLLSGVKPKLPF